MRLPHRIDRIYFHGKCPDGMAGAWSALTYFQNMYDIYHDSDNQLNPVETTVIPWNRPSSECLFPIEHNSYKQKLTEELVNYVYTNHYKPRVVVIDFSFDLETTKLLIENCEWFMTIDHYDKALQALDELKEDQEHLILDMKRSGAQIAWDFFNKGLERPKFIDYIGDLYLWNCSLPWSREFSVAFYEDYLSVEGFDIESFNELHEFTLDDYHKMFKNGEIYLRLKNKRIQNAVKFAKRYKMGKYVVWASQTCENRSDVGTVLAKREDCDFSVTWCFPDPLKDEYWISLHGVQSKGFNLSEIAQEFNKEGGGHPSASGFTWKQPIKQLFSDCE